MGECPYCACFHQLEYEMMPYLDSYLSNYAIVFACCAGSLLYFREMCFIKLLIEFQLEILEYDLCSFYWLPLWLLPEFREMVYLFLDIRVLVP